MVERQYRFPNTSDRQIPCCPACRSCERPIQVHFDEMVLIEYPPFNPSARIDHIRDVKFAFALRTFDSRDHRFFMLPRRSAGLPVLAVLNASCHLLCGSGLKTLPAGFTGVVGAATGFGDPSYRHCLVSIACSMSA